MKPSPFEYHAPSEVPAALELLAHLDDEMTDARVLAGGQSLIPMMNLRMARPEHLVDIQNIPGLDAVTITGPTVSIGSMATHDRVERHEQLHAIAPVFRQVAGHVGHRQIRTAGTFGGSVAHADPAAEWPLLCTLLDASMRVVGRTDRTIAARDFFRGHYITALGPSDLLVGVDLHLPEGRHAIGFSEFSRRHGDFALAAAGALVVLARERVSRAQVVLAGAADRPVLFEHAAAVGMDLKEAASPDVGRSLEVLVHSSVDPHGDANGTAAFRSSLLATVARRAWAEAVTLIATGV